MKNVILDRWRAVVARRGRETAVLSPDGQGARTFAEVDAESDELARHLGNLSRGAVVSLQAPNIPSWPAKLLGIWKAGGCAVMVDHALGDASRDAAEQLCGASIRLSEHGETRLAWVPANFSGVAPDLIKLTSGTSGAPRAVLFTAAQLEADCDQVCETMGIGENDVNYGIVAFSHSYGFSNLVTPLLCRGVPVVAARDALPRAVMHGIAATGATVFPAVPAVFQALAGLDGNLPGVRLCISAGAPLRPETGRIFRTRFGLKIHTFYGASECGGIAYDADADETATPGLVGKSMVGVGIDSADDGGIQVRSAAVGIGYFPAPEEDRFHGVFKPADFLESTPEGWKITGRRLDVINVGGRKTTPTEIENVLLSYPSVHEAVAFGVGHDRRTEAVYACVVADDKIDESALRAHCAGRLSAWQVPRKIVQLEAIPVNSRGKVSRADLARQFSEEGQA